MTQPVFAFGDRWPARCQGVDPAFARYTGSFADAAPDSSSKCSGYSQVLDQPVSPVRFGSLGMVNGRASNL